jgi:2,4-dienoyl-CoA reductase-like NADH-dependent reductase (Old Yellow Enzyme family)
MRSKQTGHIGSLEIKNRIAMAPMISNLANPDGTTNEAHLSYLEARAKGGAGLIITEYTYINDLNSRGSRNELGAFSSTQVPKLRRIPESLHKYGTKAFMQIVHAGGKALQDENRKKPMAPSPVDYLGRIPSEMSGGDIEEVVKDFEKAALTAYNAKFDGIEIHGAHGYLIHEFISPNLNIRQDRYGGSFEKRLIVPQMIIDAVRQVKDIPAGIRLSLYEDDPNGFDPSYGLKVAESLHGIDYVHFSAGNFNPPGSSASFYTQEAHVFSKLPRKPKITSMIVGSLVNAESIEKALEICDFVSVGRGMLADPSFSIKVMNSPSQLRPCIRCNQGCRDLAYGEVRCTVNPSVGYEYRRPERYSGEITIIGAGIQGLEAALFAAKSGLNVTLYESSEAIGGQLNQITDEFKKRAFNPLLTYYRNALGKIGVNLLLNSKYTGSGIYCLPLETYPNIPEDADLVESNIYAHHDSFLSLAKSRKLTVGLKSLNSLDRARKSAYMQIAASRGIEFVESADFSFSLIVKEQYDIMQAMNAGRTKISLYIAENRSDFL